MTESTPENDVTVPKNLEEEKDTIAVVAPPNERRRKKKSGAFNILKAAMRIMRKPRSKKKSVAKTDLMEPVEDQNLNWTKMVESVRPFHLQEIGDSPPPSPPASPAASSSLGTMGQYSSAASLLDLLDNSSDEEEDPDEVFDALTGDEMIDAKAHRTILYAASKDDRHHLSGCSNILPC